MESELITTARRPTSSGCGCGCGGDKDTGCSEACCTLDTLVRPQFFCGQLVTDRGLTGLVDGTRGRRRLARGVAGWGGVCGLDVRCGPAGTVTVTRGHAVSCCG